MVSGRFDDVYDVSLEDGVENTGILKTIGPR